MNPAKTYLDNFEHASVTTRPLVQQVKAMLMLGLADEALKFLPVAPDGMHAEADLEALRLACLDQKQTPSASLVEAALRALNRRRFEFGTYLLAITHLLHQGRHQDILELEKRFRSSHLSFFGQTAVIVACAAARLGQFSTALHLLACHYDGTLPAGHLIAESRLLPLWDHYARTRPAPAEARLILEAGFESELLTADRPDFRGQISDFDQAHLLPHRLRPLLERHLGGTWTMRPDAPDDQRRIFHEWNRARIIKTIQCVRQSLDRAESVRRTTSEQPQTASPPSTSIPCDDPEAERRYQLAREALLVAAREQLLDQAEEHTPVLLGAPARCRQ